MEGMHADISKLEKLPPERRDALLRRLVEEGHDAWPSIAAEVDAYAPPVPNRRFLLDATSRGKDNEDWLSIKFLKLERWATDGDYALRGQQPAGATQSDVEKCRAFPQRTYVEKREEYLFPVTPGNVEHLLASWTEEQYGITAAARMMLDIYFGNLQASESALSDRARFLAEGVAPKVDGYHYVAEKPPYQHQLVAFASARDAEYFALIMDPGTGKSRCVIDVACDRARRLRMAWIQAHGGPADADPNEPWQDDETGERAPQFRLLIVAPKTVCRTWVREFEKWATLNVNVERLSGNRLQRAGLFATLLSDQESPVLAAIINYDGLEVIEEYLKPPDDSQIWDLMICDESIFIKNPSAKRSQAVYRVGGAAKSRFILNGTPISKNLLDLYGQYHFVKPGCLGYTSKGAFDKHFGETSYFGGHAGHNKDNLTELQSLFSRFSYVIRRDQCVKLPPKIYETLEPELEGEQKEAYLQMSQRALVNLETLVAGQELDDAGQRQQLALLLGEADDSKLARGSIVLVEMLRLAQITSGFMTMEDGTTHVFKEQPKLDALEEHLDSLHDDQRIVVWSRFRPEIEATVKRFQARYGATALYGGLNDKQREQRLDAHEKGRVLPENRVPTRLIVIQPQTGGFGLNELIGSTDVSYLSNDWSLLLRQQSEDRTHRIGVEASVLINDFIVPGTIDQIMWERIQEKRELSDLLTNPQNIINALRSGLNVIKNK